MKDRNPLLDIQCDVRGTSVTVEDPIMGKRTFNGTDHVALIKDQLKYLQAIRLKKIMHNQPVTDHLKKDIATYAYMLNQPDPKATIQEYFLYKGQAKAEGKNPLNFQIAESLGWKI